jgi:hypothetical protein
MHPHFGIFISQVTIFSHELDSDHEVAIRFPGWGDSLFFPLTAREHKVPNVELLIVDGEVESGEKVQVILDSNLFPLALVAVPKPENKPRREFGFSQTPASSEMPPSG